jgi:hypothetical protein
MIRTELLETLRCPQIRQEKVSTCGSHPERDYPRSEHPGRMVIERILSEEELPACLWQPRDDAEFTE